MAAGSLDEMYTRAPSPTSASAHARPIPLLAAVTRARRPFSPKSMKKGTSARDVDVPVGDVAKAVERLDRLVHMDAVHTLRHRVLVPPRVQKAGRRRVGPPHLKVDVR